MSLHNKEQEYTCCFLQARGKKDKAFQTEINQSGGSESSLGQAELADQEPDKRPVADAVLTLLLACCCLCQLIKDPSGPQETCRTLQSWGNDVVDNQGVA